MAKNENETLTADTWTLITATGENVTAASGQNLGSSEIRLMATTSEVAPTDSVDGYKLAPGDAFTTDTPFSVLYPGVTSPVRLYAKSLTKDGLIFISHG